jgi:Ca2+-transporting ATPase
VVATIALQFALIYVPFLQRVFGTAPLSLAQIGICLGLSVVVTLGIEARKAIAGKPVS